MSAFGEYADYYDLFYKDKDYAGEAAFVNDLIGRFGPSTRAVLDLGCGTGRHALELVRRGYSVRGVDRSPRMVDKARQAARELPPGLRTRFSVRRGDVTKYRGTKTHDAVISLFHVVDYQTTTKAMRGFFESARRSLRRDGVFVFDFWYGPAVLTDRPSVRNRCVTTVEARVTRVAEPVLRVNQNVVDVSYTLRVEDVRSGQTREFKETHSMRYLFLPELEMFGSAAGLKVIASGQWLSNEPLSDKTWLGWAVMRAT